MTGKEFHHILRKYLKGKGTAEEEHVIDQFYARNQSKDLLDDYTEKEEAEARRHIKSRVLDAIRSEASANKQAVRHRFMKVAASVVIIFTVSLGVYKVLTSETEVVYLTKTTQKGQKATITLSDGSEVKLNAESTLIYPEAFTGDIRNIQLKGEAFFNVAKDRNRPFTVNSYGVVTTVLGTSFNVSAFPEEDIKVTVATGKVSVSSEEQQVELTPGEQATYQLTDKHLVQEKVAVESFIAWKDGILQFTKSSLPEIASALERWYGVTITFSEAQSDHCQLRMTFDNLTLRQTLEQLAIVADVRYHFRNNGQIEITGVGCSN